MSSNKADDIAGLLHQKKLAIEDLDFDLAESLHFQIIKETDRMAYDNFSILFTNHENEIRTLLIHFDEKISELMKLNEDTKKQIDNDFNTRVEAKKQEVENEIIKLNDLVGTEETHEYDDDIIQLQESARKEATLANFNSARKLKEEADLLVKARNLTSKQHLADELRRSKEQLQEARDGFVLELAKERIRKEQSNALRHGKEVEAQKRAAADSLRVFHQRRTAEAAALTASETAQREFSGKLDKLYKDASEHVQHAGEPPAEAPKNEQTAGDDTFVTRSAATDVRKSRSARGLPKSRFF